MKLFGFFQHLYLYISITTAGEKKMAKKAKHKEILKTLAPCGLNCLKCFAYGEGEIKFHSSKLSELLGAFDRYAERFSRFSPVFSKYPSFKEVLAFLAQGNCLGCRKGTCRYPDCGVILCYKQKGVDFCFQCEEFPCQKTNFDPDLKRRWLEMNMRVKEIGLEAYFEKTKSLPRYK
jgi:hypothetical protein